MARKQTTGDGASENGFRISAGPVIRQGMVDLQLPADLLELQTAGGPPVLFAIPRDPQTIFAYWNIDWDAAFAKSTPEDRQVFLRLRKSDGTEESETVVEPLLGTHYANVATPGGQYQTEIGFYDSGGWSPVATSQLIEMPPAGASSNADLDLATVPFHLSFQRMIDMFRASTGNALGAILTRLQARASGEANGLTNDESELLRAMKVSVADLTAAAKSFDDEDDALRRKTEAVLGFGATSPGKAFGESSWDAGSSSSSPSR